MSADGIMTPPRCQLASSGPMAEEPADRDPAQRGVQHLGHVRYRQDLVFANLLVPSIVPLPQNTVDSTLQVHSSTSALFASVRRHWRAFESELGVRLDSQDYRAFGRHTQLTPRLNLRYDPATDWHLYASWGEFSQAQRVDEFREEENQSSPDAATRASHTVVGIAHEPAGATHWRVELYRNHWSSVSPYDINALGLATLLPELQPDRIRIAPLSSESDGIELSARRSLGKHFNLWGTYTLSQAIDELPSGDVPRSWDQRQAANLGLAWNSPLFTTSVFLGWHSGWPRTSISAITGLPNNSSYLLLGTTNAGRLGDYLSADVHISRSILTRLGELSLWLEITNATNRSNDCCAELAPVVPPAILPTWSTDSWAGRSANLGLSWRLQKSH
jgi:outer membrane receptor protein involved in Fe transport